MERAGSPGGADVGQVASSALRSSWGHVVGWLYDVSYASDGKADFKEQLQSRCCVYVYMTMCVGPLEVPPEEWLQDGPETAQGPALLAADQEATAGLGAMVFAFLNLLNFNPKP